MRRFLVAACLAALASPAMAEQSDCDGAAFRAAVTANPAWRCAEIERRTLAAGGTTITARALRGTETPEDAVAQHAARALDALETAVATLDGMAAEFGWQFADVSVVLVDPATVAFDPHAFGLSNAYADANGYAFETDCIIRLNIPTLDSGGLDTLDATIAHEFAHCAQYWSYGLKNLSGAPHGWWVESTATLFEDMVSPDETVILDRFKRFAKSIETVPLTQQPYSGMVFFAWVAQHHRDRLAGLLRDLAGAGSEDAHQAVLAATFGQEGIDDFARAFADGTIVMPSGYALPAMIDPSETIIVDSDSGAYPIPYTPFTLTWRGIALTDGTYRLASPTPLAVRPLEGGDWAPLQPEVPLGPETCGDVLQLVAAHMLATPGAASVQGELTSERATACSGCHVPTEAPACPVGTWSISNAEVASMLQGWFDEDYAAMDYGDSATVEAVLGEVTLSLKSDGNAAWDFSGFEYNIEYVTPDLPFPVGIQVIGNGLVPGRWGASGGQLRWCPGDAPVEWLSRVDMQAMGVHEVPFPAPLPESHWYLSCDGDSMTLDYIGPIDMGRDDVHWDFSRVN